MNKQSIFTSITHELDVFLAFSWRDWSTTIIPGSLFSIGAMRSSRDPHPTIVYKYSLLVSWLTLFIYFFTTSNQIVGVDEDRINKPDRPIPSGKVTLEGAKRRWASALLMFLAVGVFKPMLLPEIVCWIATTAFLCLTSAGNHWFGKNCIAMTTGTWALLSASWKVIAPATSESERYVITVSVWVGLMMPLQDLRDMLGDAVVGRKTLPLVVGDDASRWIITFFFMPAAFWILWMGGIVSIAPITLVAVHIFLGYRLMHAGGPRYDHKTYMIFTYIFCLVLALTAAKGSNLGITEMLQVAAGKVAKFSVMAQLLPPIEDISKIDPLKSLAWVMFQIRDEIFIGVAPLNVD
ncbi:UbiA prenyltransferase family-domain-containing protein [Collybia nuda]|uniref:UbiA prenyltransferase family-domain-containing protein n=1 Tax=Collybia nuda TaxID=64659 RepID=A0A9P5XX55_9AGAR|nr:UbiA prenyltransferase family-domain-containing protein [Collybia nuda]